MINQVNYKDDNLLFLPDNDGINHINIYNKGKTELGQMLSHYAYSPFVHPYFGPFNSMEGFWYYLRAERKDEKLRQLYGAQAKFYGKKLVSVKVHHFNILIVDANYHKIIQNPRIANLLVQSSLPFDHYYTDSRVNGGHKVKIHGFEWLIGGFERIREELKSGQPHIDLDYEQLLSES